MKFCASQRVSGRQESDHLTSRDSAYPLLPPAWPVPGPLGLGSGFAGSLSPGFPPLGGGGRVLAGPRPAASRSPLRAPFLGRPGPSSPGAGGVWAAGPRPAVLRWAPPCVSPPRAPRPPRGGAGPPEMGQTVFWPKIGPITTDFDETRGDLIPPMRPRIWSGSRGRGGPKIEFLSWGGGGPMYAIVYPAGGAQSRPGSFVGTGLRPGCSRGQGSRSRGPPLWTRAGWSKL